MLTFILVLSLPLIFLLPSLNKNIWNEVNQGNLVKHKLLASSLVEPIKLHILSQQSELKLLDDAMQANDLNDTKKSHMLIEKFIHSNENIVALSLMLVKDKSVEIKINDSFQPSVKPIAKELDYILAENRYRIYDKENGISPVAFKSSISNKPSIVLRHQLIAKDGEKLGTLIAELGLGFMQKICGQIVFGKQGHCTIVDNNGKVVADSKASWVSNMLDLSQDEIFTKLQRGGSGSLDYFSSGHNEKMVAGFAKVDSINWGVMVSQPKAEIDSPFAGIKNAVFIWVAVGVLVALFIAFFVTRMITRPLNTLVSKAKELDVRSETFRLGDVPKRSPIEIKILWNQLAKLIVDFQEANFEVKSLSGSLSKDLRKVVAELRENNLRKTRNLDLLTGLTNKECFTTELGKSLQIHKGEEVGVILFDIDSYKSLVTKNGQEAGNEVLKHVANILRKNIRNGDMAVRYNDVDRFAIYINYSNPESLQGTADKLRALVESSPVIWEDDAIYLNLSMSLVINKIDEKLTVDSLMAEAEQVLENSKYPDQKNAKVA